MVHCGPWWLPGRESAPDGAAAWTDVIEAAVNATSDSVATVTMRRRQPPAVACAMTCSSNKDTLGHGRPMSITDRTCWRVCTAICQSPGIVEDSVMRLEPPA